MDSEDSDTAAISSTEEDFYVEDNLDEEESNFFEENIETVDSGWSDHEEEEEEEEEERLEKNEHFNNYEVISAQRIAEEMKKIISEVGSIVNIPKTLTRILLSHFKWDRDKLIDKYYDGDQKKLFAEAHIVNPFDCNESENEFNQTNECQVCYTTVDSSDMSGLPCGHLFCTECWAEYLKTKIISEGEADSIGKKSAVVVGMRSRGSRAVLVDLNSYGQPC